MNPFGPRTPPPRQVPTLTEVVDEGGAEARDVLLPEPGDAALPATDDVPATPSPADAERQLVERVLDGVQRQIDPVLEQRLREALVPLLARWSDALVEDVRLQLTSSLHDMVAQAVAREIERQRRA